MQLWENGQLSLEEDINIYLPEPIRNPHFPDIPITIQQLLTHTSSINDGSAYGESYSCGDPKISLTDWITNYLRKEGTFYNEMENFLLKEPGEQHQYSNVGYGLLGYIVEEITDKPFNSYCQQHICILSFCDGVNPCSNKGISISPLTRTRVCSFTSREYIRPKLQSIPSITLSINRVSPT